MAFRTMKLITRATLRAEPKTLFVFGDNMKQAGYGGQAAAMRGEPNAVGIPTKWSPAMTKDAFFSDGDLFVVAIVINHRFRKLSGHLARGGDVVWPADGIGTGRAQLKQRAPAIWAMIEKGRAELERCSYGR